MSSCMSLSRIQTNINPSLNPKAIIDPSFVMSAQFILLCELRIVKHPTVGKLCLSILRFVISKGIFSK